MAIMGWEKRLDEVLELYDSGMCVQQEVAFTVAPWFNGAHDDELLWAKLPSWAQKKIWDGVKDISESSEIVVWQGSEGEVRSKLSALKLWLSKKGLG